MPQITDVNLRSKRKKLFDLRCAIYIIIRYSLISLALGLSVFRPSLAEASRDARETRIETNFKPTYIQLQMPEHDSSPQEIERYGQTALRQSGIDRVYRLWRVLYIYRDDESTASLQRWIIKVRMTATSEHDLVLMNLADFFQTCFDQIVQNRSDSSHTDWARFLNHSGPDIRVMALFEEAEKQVDAKHWARGAELASEGIKEAEARGPRTLSLRAELYEAYGDALEDMGHSEGSITQLAEAVKLDHQAELPTRHLERIWGLARAAQSAGELGLADKLARLHLHYAVMSEHPYWTYYLCAETAAGREQWMRVLDCLYPIDKNLNKPRNSKDAVFLRFRSMARARLGDLVGAKSDLYNLQKYIGSDSHDLFIEKLDHIYIEKSDGRNAAAFEHLDQWRRSFEASTAQLHASQMSDVASALEAQLKRKSAESDRLVERVRLSHNLTIAWSVGALLLAILTAGSLGWIVYLQRVSRKMKFINKQAQSANEAKSRFLANMSHELRTPLNGMLGMAQALSVDNLTETQRTQVKVIEGSGRALLGVLSDILDVSRIENGNVEILPVRADLISLCHDIVNFHRFAAEAKNTKIYFGATPDTPKFLFFDIDRVRQCVSNLISNAVKFTDDGEIDVQVSVDIDAKSRHTVAKVTVKDSGVGMSPQTLGGLFGSFFQADTSVSRRFGGAGVGLNLTQRLAQLMSGSITVTSKEGRGSTFTFTFLASPELDLNHSVEMAHSSDSQHDLSGNRVLVVDDHPINRQVARLFLDSCGFEVFEAANGAIALETLNSFHIDLVLMDVNMPVMDGLEATRRLRADPRWIHLPVIALTAAVGEEHERTCASAGMDGYIAKPYDAETLIHEVFSLLAGGRNTLDRPVTSPVSVDGRRVA